MKISKKFIYFFIPFCLGAMLVASCEKPTVLVQQTEDLTGKSIVEVQKDAYQITLTGVQGRELYLARINNDDNSSVGPYNVRCVEGTQNVTERSSTDEDSIFENDASEIARCAPEIARCAPEVKIPQNFQFEFSDDSPLSRTTTPAPNEGYPFYKGNFSNEVTPLSRNPRYASGANTAYGDNCTKKYLFIYKTDDYNYLTDIYLMKFELAATGDHCNVLVPCQEQDEWSKHWTIEYRRENAYLTDTQENCPNDILTNLSQENCLDIANKYEIAYEYENAMFGSHSQQMWRDGNNPKNPISVSKICDTRNSSGECITNIVIYDFENISNLDTANGFFSQKDFFPNMYSLYQTTGTSNFNTYFYSNEGCYIYINYKDIDFNSNYGDIIANRKKKRDKVVAHYAEQGETISIPIDPDSYLTLCHEYMHYLQYARKCIEANYTDWDVAYGEMLGQLCEDAMCDILGIPAEYSVQNYRLKEFTRGHNFSGIMEHCSDNYSTTYSIEYAFGIFLTRNYGGAKLLSAMLKNRYDSWDSIINAISEAGYGAVTREELVKQFAQSLVNPNSPYTWNKDSASLSVNGKNLIMHAVNLFDLSKYYPSYFYSERIARYWETYLANSNSRNIPNDGANSQRLHGCSGVIVSVIGKPSSDKFEIDLTKGGIANHQTYIIAK